MKANERRPKKWQVALLMTSYWIVTGYGVVAFAFRWNDESIVPIVRGIAATLLGYCVLALPIETWRWWKWQRLSNNNP